MQTYNNYIINIYNIIWSHFAFKVDEVLKKFANSGR